MELQLNDVFEHPTIRKLSEYIAGAEKRLYYSIEAQERKEYYLLSPAQKGLYALHEIAPTSTAYNEFTAVILEEDVDPDRLAHCLKAMLHRHASLRTSFIMLGESPVQWIHDEVEFGIEYYDLNRTQVEVEARVKEERSSNFEGTRGLVPLPDAHLAKEPAPSGPRTTTDIISSFIRPFDLSRAPLLRVGLIKLKTGKHIFMVDMHHIVSDGTSMILLTNEFITIYSNKELPPLRLQYNDYCEWQRQLLISGKLKEQEAYWLKRLEGDLPVLDLPTDFPRPKLQSFAGDILFFEIGKKETGALRALALKEGATLQMVMLTIFYILLARVSRQEDIIVGIPITGRRHADLGNVIGMFVNTLALRNFPVKEKTFLKFLQEVKKNSLDAYDNQDYQFESLVKKLGPGKDTSRNPLFDVIFEIREMQTLPGTEAAANGPGTPGKPTTGIPRFQAEPYGFNQNITKFDLDWNGEETPQGIRFWVFYCTKLFAKESIELLKDRYLALLEAVIENPRAKIQELDHRTPLEKKLDQVQEVTFNF